MVCFSKKVAVVKALTAELEINLSIFTPLSTSLLDQSIIKGFVGLAI